MTDLTATRPIQARRIRLPHPRLPTIPLGATIAAMATAIGRAFSLAYAAPYQAGRHRPHPAAEVLPDGRDPNW